MSLIKPYYYKGERGNKPCDLEWMLRIYMLQNLYNLFNFEEYKTLICEMEPSETS